MQRFLRQIKVQHWLWVLALYVGLSLLMTYPLALNMNDSIAGPPFDNFYYLYEVWWIKYSVFQEHISPFLDPNVFYPFGHHVLAQNHSVANTILTIPVNLVTNDVVAYNSIVLLSFVLSALGGYLLTAYLTGSRVAGVVSGVIFAFCPYRMFRLNVGHLPLLQTQWLPFLLLFVEKTVRGLRSKDALMAALFFALTILSSAYYAYLALVVLVIYVLARARPWKDYWGNRSFWSCILLFVGATSAMAAPLVYPALRAYASHTVVPAPIQSTWISASIPDFLMPNFFNPLWGSSLLPYYARNSHENFVSLGVVPVLLAFAALRRDRSRVAAVYGLLLVLTLILALGPTLQLGGATLYLRVPNWIERGFTVAMTFVSKHLAVNRTEFYWKLWVKNAIYVPLPTMLLYMFLPFFDLANYPARFAVFSSLALAVLAGTGVFRLSLAPPAGSRRLLKKPWALALVVGLILFEYAAIPPPFGMSKVGAQPVDQWLAAQEGDFAVIMYPLQKALTGPPVFGRTVHGKRIVYGADGFFPSGFVDSMNILSQFPDAESIALLRRFGVRYALVCSVSYGDKWEELASRIASRSDLRYVTRIREEPRSAGDRLLGKIREYQWLFVTDTVYIYEITS